MPISDGITGVLPDDWLMARVEYTNIHRTRTDFRAADSYVENILTLTIGPAYIATTRANWTVLRDAIDELLTAEVTA